MIRKGFEGCCRTRAQQLVMTAVFMAALGSAALASIASAAQNSTIFVNNVDDLYAAVNDQANEGATVVLAPGRYCLSVKAEETPGGDPCLSASPTAVACVWESGASGASRPHGGRLDLQKDMSLSGMAGNPATVIIDGSLLPASSFTVDFGTPGRPAPGRTAIIRTGLGSNAIEWLTIAGSQPAAAAIETDLVEVDGGAPVTSTIRVAHVMAGGSVVAAGSERPLDISCASTRGVDVRNIGIPMAGRRIDAEIVDSEVFGSTEGIRVANFSGADYGDIAVTMRGNRSHTNRLGCIVENNRTNHASISIRSSGDRFEDNGLGCQIGGGLAVMPGVANFNSTTFDARESALINNTLRVFTNLNPTGPMFTDLGGLVAVGGDLVPIDTTSGVFGNTVLVRLWASRIAGNQIGEEDVDFKAYGVRWPTSIESTNIRVLNNHALIELHGVSKFIEVTAFDSKFQDLTGTNRVTVVGEQ
jgi:hypothetical protein